ncbi:MAG: phosphate ABC transporter substrate-binding protein [Gammaproteobacteria bacterium]|nr:phosphate ABC transporter substrate-binding protein [Gammaproteobacteria bacterium]
MLSRYADIPQVRIAGPTLVLVGLGLIFAPLLNGQSISAAEKVLTWAGCGISKKAFMSEIATAYEKKTGVKIDLKGGGATKGIRQVASGKVNIGGSCRDLIHTENGISPIPPERGVRMQPVAWDALVIIVHKDNPLSDISLKQIRQLYTGKITNWSQLGGNNAPVELYIRKGKISGVGRSIRELVFQDFDQEFVARHIMPSSGPLEKGIAKNINGIGISGFSSARKRDVKMLKVEGIEPSFAMIKDGGYMLYRPLYLVTPMRAKKDEEIAKFVAYVRSEEGKIIIRNAGTVPFEDAIATWLKMLKTRQIAVGQ